MEGATAKAARSHGRQNSKVPLLHRHIIWGEEEPQQLKHPRESTGETPPPVTALKCDAASRRASRSAPHVSACRRPRQDCLLGDIRPGTEEWGDVKTNSESRSSHKRSSRLLSPFVRAARRAGGGCINIGRKPSVGGVETEGQIGGGPRSTQSGRTRRKAKAARVPYATPLPRSTTTNTTTTSSSHDTRDDCLRRGRSHQRPPLRPYSFVSRRFSQLAVQQTPRTIRGRGAALRLNTG